MPCMTGMPTSTLYPTNAMYSEIEIERQLSKAVSCNGVFGC